jgi:hypothetical protein
MRLLTVTCALVLLACAAGTASAQSYYAKESSLYAEFFGNGGELSANFEKLIDERISIRVGVGLTGVSFRKGYVTPFGVSWLLGSDRNFLEVGVGGAYVNFDADGTDDTWLDVQENQVVGTGLVGYRFLGHYGFTYRLAFTPAYTKDGFQAMGGAAFGYAF